jgi:hypothetical protein
MENKAASHNQAVYNELGQPEIEQTVILCNDVIWFGKPLVAELKFEEVSEGQQQDRDSNGIACRFTYQNAPVRQTGGRSSSKPRL